MMASHVALFQAARERTLRLAIGEGRYGVADRLAADLPGGGDRLAQRAVFLATTERGIDDRQAAFPLRRYVDADSVTSVEAAASPPPDDVATPKALLAAATRRADDAEQRAAAADARLANAQARQSATEALIAHLKLQIAKLRREQYGASAERSRRLLEHMELQLEELEADAGEDDLAAEAAAARSTSVTAFERRRPARKPFLEHLPRERVVLPAPCSWPACGGARLAKLGEDVTETPGGDPRAAGR